MRRFFNLKILKIAILVTFFEILFCVLMPLIFYLLRHGFVTSNLIYQIVKYFLFFSLLKIILMIYPLFLFFILVAFDKKIVKNRPLKFALLNGLTYLIQSVFFVVFIPDTIEFFHFNFRSEFSGFFYFALFGGIIGMVITAKLFPALFARDNMV